MAVQVVVYASDTPARHMFVEMNVDRRHPSHELS